MYLMLLLAVPFTTQSDIASALALQTKGRDSRLPLRTQA